MGRPYWRPAEWLGCRSSLTPGSPGCGLQPTLPHLPTLGGVLWGHTNTHTQHKSQCDARAGLLRARPPALEGRMLHIHVHGKPADMHGRPTTTHTQTLTDRHIHVRACVLCRSSSHVWRAPDAVPHYIEDCSMPKKGIKLQCSNKVRLWGGLCPPTGGGILTCFVPR